METDSVLECIPQLSHDVMSSGNSTQTVLDLPYGTRHNFWPHKPTRWDDRIMGQHHASPVRDSFLIMAYLPHMHSFRSRRMLGVVLNLISMYSA